MSRGRRSLLLAGLALVLAALAASDVGGREAALRHALGGVVPVVVAREPLPAGRPVRARALTVRRVPRRFAPEGALGDVRLAVGLRARFDVPAGADVVAGMLTDGQAPPIGAPVRAGERVAEVVAVGPPDLVVPGARVDVLVTREPRAGGAGDTVLALQDVPVLAARAAPRTAESAPGGADHVAASLRVTLRQAVYLAAAQSFARELRLLPRAADDRRRGPAGLAAGG